MLSCVADGIELFQVSNITYLNLTFLGIIYCCVYNVNVYTRQKQLCFIAFWQHSMKIKL